MVAVLPSCVGAWRDGALRVRRPSVNEASSELDLTGLGPRGLGPREPVAGVGGVVAAPRGRAEPGHEGRGAPVRDGRRRRRAQGRRQDDRLLRVGTRVPPPRRIRPRRLARPTPARSACRVTRDGGWAAVPAVRYPGGCRSPVEQGRDLSPTGGRGHCHRDGTMAPYRWYPCWECHDHHHQGGSTRSRRHSPG